VIDATLPLFRYAESRPVVAPTASEQSQELARCEGKLASAIMVWLEFRLSAGSPVFHASDLCSYVQTNLGGSPESGMRVMRALRAAGQVQVELESRSESRYRVEAVNG
jgi:hypothetical protein